MCSWSSSRRQNLDKHMGSEDESGAESNRTESNPATTSHSNCSFCRAPSRAIVCFVYSWCGHCKSLAPEYEIAAAAFSKFANRAVIASVDADAHRELGTRFEVKGFPSVEQKKEGIAMAGSECYCRCCR